MLGQTVVGTVVGLAFVFFLVSVAASTVVESIANLMTKRAKYLLRGLREMLEPSTDPAATASIGALARLAPNRGERKSENEQYAQALTSNPAKVRAAAAAQGATDPRDAVDREAADGEAAGDPDQTKNPITVASVMGHPLIQPFKQTRASGQVTRNPSYLPARTVADVLLSFLVPDASGKTSLDEIRTSIDALPPTPLRSALQALAMTAEGDVTRFRAALENWYDAQMDRLSGSYKRWAKRWIIVFTLVVAGFLHIDAVGIGEALWTKEPVRQAVIAAATNDTLCDSADPVDKRRQCLQQELTAVQADGLPVGLPYWTEATKRPSGWGWLTTLLGILVTTGAASLGAPFWFDVITRVAPLRNTGTKPAASPGAGTNA